MTGSQEWPLAARSAPGLGPRYRARRQAIQQTAQVPSPMSISQVVRRVMGLPPFSRPGMGEQGGLDGEDGGGWVEGAAGAAAQRAPPIGRALVLEPSFPAAGGRVLAPGQLEREPGLEGDLDQPPGPTPPWVAVLADAAV